MGNEKRCAKTQPMDDVEVDTTKQIGRILRDTGDRMMGEERHFSKLTPVFCRVLVPFSGWLWVREGRRAFFSAACRLILPYTLWLYNMVQSIYNRASFLQRQPTTN